MFDSVHPAFVTANLTTQPDYTTNWPFEPDTALPFITEPYGDLFSLDFNRHGKLTRGNKASDPSMNVLFCDGHSATVSCRDAFRDSLQVTLIYYGLTPAGPASAGLAFLIVPRRFAHKHARLRSIPQR